MMGLLGNAQPDFQHVYVTVPVNGSKSGLNSGNDYITVDPVVGKFNHEVPYLEKHDRFMALGNKGFSGLGCGCESSGNGGSASDTRGNGGSVSDTGGHRKGHPYYAVPVKILKENGQIITEEFLNDNGIPFTLQHSADGGVRLIVTTKNSETISLLPVIGPVTAQETLAQYNAPKKEEPVKKAGSLFWWIVGGAAALILIAGSGNSNESKPSGLAGLPAPKRKKSARKLKTVRID
jgi:hypothetical protein